MGALAFLLQALLQIRLILRHGAQQRAHITFPRVWHGVLENLLILVVVSISQFHPLVLAACLIMDTIAYPKP